MGIFLNRILKHVLTLSMLTFVVMPFVSNLAQGSPLNALPSMVPALLSGPSGGIPSGIPTSVAGIQRSIASMGHGLGGGGSLYLGGAHPIFLN